MTTAAQSRRARHCDDGNRSALAAAYLAACVFHALMHDEPPQRLPASLTPAAIQPNPEGRPAAGMVAADESARMQEIAWSTTSQWRKKTQSWYLKPGRK